MNRNIAIVLIVVVLIGAGAAGYLTRGSIETAPAPIEAAPAVDDAVKLDFSLPDLEGNVHQLSDWDGKARLVNFWATWCAPCRREIPLLKKTQAEHADDDVQVIGVAVDFQEEVVAYAEEAQFNYPILIGQEDAMAAAEATGLDFIGMPFTMIVAPTGELLKAHIGEIVESHIETILDVFADLRAGDIDVAGARERLRDL